MQTPDGEKLAGPHQEVAAAVDAGRLTATLKDRFGVSSDVAGVALPLSVNARGDVVLAKDVLKAAEWRAHAPLRRRGASQFFELASAIDYVNRYKDADAVAWADPNDFAICAILDYHPATVAMDVGGAPRTLLRSAGWCQHRAVYTCPRAPEWKAWTERDGEAMTQDAFADFVEAHLEDLATKAGYPKPVEMLEMARNLLVRTQGTFQRVIDPTTGTGTLVCKTEHEASSTKIPRAFLLGLRVFEGGEPYEVEARVRFTMEGGRPRFAFVLHRRVEIERDAFGDVRKAFAAGTSIPIFAGRPEGSPSVADD